MPPCNQSIQRDVRRYKIRKTRIEHYTKNNFQGTTRIIEFQK